MGKYLHEISLKNQSSQPIIPTQVILHSLGNANNFESGWGWMVDPGNPLEAHLAIRLDGYRRQAVPYGQRADANYTANHRADGTGAVSIETDSTIDALEPWTDDQVESIIEVVTEICREYNIPPKICESPTDPGIGWHIMWGTPGAWTPVAKACPGPARIAQVPYIVARVAANLTQIEVKPISSEEDTVTPQDKEDIAALVVEKLLATRIEGQDTTLKPISTTVKGALVQIFSVGRGNSRIGARTKAIAKKVGLK